MVDRVLKVRKKAIISVNIWVIACIMLVICAQLPLYFFASLDFRADAFLWVSRIVDIWTAILASVAGFNILAFIQVTRLQRSRRNSLKTSTEPNVVRKRMDKIIVRIQTVTLCVIVLDAVVMSLLWYQLPSFERTIVSNPRCYFEPAAFALRICVIFWMGLFLAALWFVAPCILTVKKFPNSFKTNPRFPFASSTLPNNLPSDQAS